MNNSEVEILRVTLAAATDLIASMGNTCRAALNQRTPPGDKAEELRIAAMRSEAWLHSVQLNGWVNSEIIKAEAALDAAKREKRG
jgi:hypothetical protein